MQESTRQDDNWEAFRYVSGEMTEADRRAFELRLQDDEGLCDAVEQAVALNEAICFASRDLRAVGSSAWDTLRRRPEVWAAALTACVLLAVGIGWIVCAVREPSEIIASGTDTSPNNPRDEVEEVVSLFWADLQRKEVDLAQGPTTTPWTEPIVVAAVENPQFAPDVFTEVTPPQWLLTAVAGERRAEAKETP